MTRQRKVKKSLIQEIKKTLHSLTKPKRLSKKTKSRKTTSTKTTTKNKADSRLELQKKLEQDLTRKMTQGMQKIKQEMEQELLEKLTSKKAKAATNSDKKVSADVKKTKVRKVSKGVTTGKSPSKTTKEKFKPKTDCTLLKLLTLSESLERRVVVGYEVLDNSSQEIWGIDIHEGTKLGRAKKILNTKVKSRKVGPERQYYLVHVTDDALYYSEEYAKSVLERGRLTIRKYTPELADAIKSAYDSGYKNNSKLPKLG